MDNGLSEEHFLDTQNFKDEEIQPMPIRRIAQYVGKSFDWVKSRIDQFSDEVVMLPDSRNHLRVNYSSVAIMALKAEADASRAYPVMNETDISINGLATALQRDEKWVRSRLVILDINATEKRNPVNNNIYGYYDKESDLSALSKEDERIKSYPIATEDYGTVETLSQILGHAPRWIRRRLRYIVTLPTVMINPGNRSLDLFFPLEETLSQIVELPNHFEHLKHRETNSVHPSQKPNSENTYQYVDALDREVVYEPESVGASNWMNFAECAQIDPDLFSALERGSATRAKEVCGQCAVRLFCLDYALANDIDTGIYGGLSPGERKNIQLKVKALD